MARRQMRLRNKLMFQYDSRSKDTDGFETQSWSDKGYRFCEVVPMQGREYWDAHAVLGSQGVKVRCRYVHVLKDVEPDRWRIKNKSTVYSIQSMINVDMKNKWLEFVCTTGTGVLD